MDTSSSILQTLRRESLDIYNRLHSIADDASFVTYVHEFYPDVPLVPNLRCGAWYADPTLASSIPAYFKSTDGHNNNWGFNLRRPNLHLLPLIAEHHRAGKRIPDALSKTVPIWCAVVNRAITRRYPGPDKGSWDTALYTPAGAVSAQEHHQIELRIDAWADALFHSSFELPTLIAPLRPFWITPATTTFPSIANSSHPPFLPIICLSASRQNDDARRPGGFAYVQGSGDDHELWGIGLTPTHYWRHTSTLLAATRSELPGLIQMLISEDMNEEHDRNSNTKTQQISEITKVYGRLRIGTFAEVQGMSFDNDTAYVLLPATSEALSRLSLAEKLPVITLPLAPRIKTHLVHNLLPRALPFIGKELQSGRTVCVICGGDNTGSSSDVGDEGVAILLAALVVFFDGDGRVIVSDGEPHSTLDICDHEGVRDAVVESAQEPTSVETVEIPARIDKTCIRTRLEWIIACRPSINPARATLKRLNEFLLSAEHRRRH
ncbi:hypothetical protein H0H87_002911 [Tephrocybe sp. NHM501043]|nr:hypothetical protein H0H87_002911 [Tephrocybe sp. NHM501043]